jgi:ribose transport system substrate-binding protein
MSKGRSLLGPLALAVALATAGCGSSNDDSSSTGASAGADAGGSAKGKVVVNLMPSLDNPFMAAYVKSFESEAAKIGLKVKTQTNPFDPVLQSQQITDAIAQKPALLNILPSNEVAILPALQRAKAAGIPVVIATSPLRPGNEKLYTSFYGPSQVQLGTLAGENMCKALTSNGRKGGRVALITGAKTFYLVGLRAKGFLDAIKACPGGKITVVATEDGKFDTVTSQNIASQLLSKYRGDKALDGIYGMADNQAGGVVAAAKRAKVKLGTKPGELVVVGSNCLADGVKYIKSGDMYSTNTDIPTVQGPENARLIVQLLEGKKLDKDIYDPAESITKANLAEFAEQCDI